MEIIEAKNTEYIVITPLNIPVISNIVGNASGGILYPNGGLNGNTVAFIIVIITILNIVDVTTAMIIVFILFILLLFIFFTINIPNITLNIAIKLYAGPVGSPVEKTCTSINVKAATLKLVLNLKQIKAIYIGISHISNFK